MVRAESKKGEKLSSRLWTLDNGITINYCRGSIERLPEMLMEAIDNAADISDEFKRYGRGGRLSDETPKFPCEGYAGKRFPEIG